MLFADSSLARRVEAAEAAIARACCGENSAVLEIAGGCAIFAGVDSPLTQAVGLGLNGPVTESELGRLEAFFHRYGARPKLDVCPLADAGLLDALTSRYRIVEFNNVLVRSLDGLEVTLTPRVHRAVAGERDLWSHAVGCGFFEQAELTRPEVDVGRAIFDMPGALCYLTSSESGSAAGGGAMAVFDRLAILFSDSTIPKYRRLGLHRELIASRLQAALARGCTLAAASTLPGSPSQRNFERLGFQVVYTKTVVVG